MPSVTPVSEMGTERKMAFEKSHWIFWSCWILLCLYGFGLYSKSNKIKLVCYFNLLLCVENCLTQKSFFEKYCFGNSHTVGENVSLYDN